MPSPSSPPASAPVIVAVAPALPAHNYAQAELLALVGELLDAGDRRTLARWFASVGVERRHTALPAAAYPSLRGFGASNRAWIDAGLELATEVAAAALDQAGLAPRELDLLATTTVTGLAVPTLDARLCNALGLAPTLARLPLFGLGCVGGAAGLARVADYLRAYPDRAAMLLAVELCTLTLQRDDPSIANRIAAALFGDGAAAVLLVGAAHPLAAAPSSSPRVLASRAALFPNTERMMGWDVVDTGFRLVLDAGVPALVERELPGLVDRFLAAHGLARADIDAWLAHPGGPAVIRAAQRGLGLDDGQLEPTIAGLRAHGNLSSASVLFVLDEVRRERAPAPGRHGLLFALGPGFCAELVLLRW